MGYQTNREFNESIRKMELMQKALDEIQEGFEGDEFIHPNYQEWKERLIFFKNNRQWYRHNRRREALPLRLWIYRGGTPHGFSWTLSREKAYWFANRFSTVGLGQPVYALPINREEVIWCSDERGEEEVVILPFNLRYEPILLQEAKPPDKEEYMERFLELAKEMEQGVTADVPPNIEASLSNPGPTD
jgi:hypothetical protein